MAVRVAGCCDSAEGAFTATRLYPATKSHAKPADLERFLRPCKPCSKPPEFRSKTVCRILPPLSRQSRRTGRHGGSQARFLVFYDLAVQTGKAALGIGQSMFRYHTVENSDHIRFL